MPNGREQLIWRTKRFAVDVINFSETLPRSLASQVIGRQLLRSATSVAANYRAARRARSPKDFISKMGIVEEEADETMFWLELLQETAITDSVTLQMLRQEAHELLAMTVASVLTARRRLS